MYRINKHANNIADSEVVQRRQSKDRPSLVGIRDRKMLSYFWFSVHETAGIESTSGDHESRSGEKEKNL